MSQAEANGNGQGHVGWTPPVENVGSGWARLPDGKLYVTLVFEDELGKRVHLLSGDAAEVHGKELQRLAGFVKLGMEPPATPPPRIVRP